MKDKISVIIPVYNVKEYLRKCLDSVINQTYKNLEIIIVSDGPEEDNKICEEYAQKDKRIIIIKDVKKRLGGARNAGLDIATGDYVAFLDSDDWISKNFYGALLKATLKEHSDGAIGETWYVHKDYIDKKGFVQQHSFKTSVKNICTINEKQNIIYSCAVWNKLYKRSIIEKYHLRFSENSYIEDVPFNFAYTVLAKKITKVRKAVLYYRQRNESMLNNAKSNKSAFDIFNIYRLCDEFIEKVNLKPQLKQKYKKILVNYKIFNIYGWLCNIKNTTNSEEFFIELTNLYKFLYIKNNEYITKENKTIYEAAVLAENEQDFYNKIQYKTLYDFYPKLKKYKNNTILFWGASLFLEDLIKNFDLSEYKILGIVDKNKTRQGEKLGNYTIYPPEKINELTPDYVIFSVQNCNQKRYEEICKNWKELYPDVKLAPNLF